MSSNGYVSVGPVATPRYPLDIDSWAYISCNPSTSGFYFQNGQPLNDYNNNCHTKDGKVAYGVDLQPNYQDANFSDVSFFMPYEELHLAQGYYDLYFTLQMFNDDQNILGEKSFYFTYTR